MGFNPGDIVECVEGGRLLTEGKQYTVDAVRNGMVFIRGKYNDGSTPVHGEYPWRFKLVRTAPVEAEPQACANERAQIIQFSKGDVIRYIGADNSKLHKGDVCMVKRMGRSGRIIIDGLYRDGTEPALGIFTAAFELVRTAAEEAKLRACGRDRIPARKTDPSTSQQAAKPKRTGLREQVLAAIAAAKSTGLTGHEAAQEIGLLRLNSITPRFAELRKAQRIKDSGQRRDGQIVWVLA